MGSKICLNESCGTTTTREWKRGWPLRSGGFGDLCYTCGSAYETSVYCDMFHTEESGWRECYMCKKRLHCGCIASVSLLEILDYGGVGCISCVKSSQLCSNQHDKIPNGFGSLATNNADDPHSTPVENRVVDGSIDDNKLTQLCKIMEANETNFLPQSQRTDTNGPLGQFRQEEVMHSVGEVGTSFSNAIQPSVASSKFGLLNVKDMNESLTQPSLSISLGAPSGSPNFVLPFPGVVVEGREQSNTPSPFQPGQRSRPILPKPSRPGLVINSETNKGMVSQVRIARPPAEGRGKSQLLPRYWPRITDQELQQLSGDLNSTIIPLFEKVLSASDAGRIGRLVLPKACAEAYFPPISQSEGLPLRIQDVKGKEWVFQFRFWPNNNSRMYVLEGVTPCIQSMQLRAGDTVTFSRIDPGGKLVMGFRKATNAEDTQDAQTSPIPNGTFSGETSISGTIENLSTVSGCSSIFQTPSRNKDPHLNAPSECLNIADADIGWNKTESHVGRANGDPVQQPMEKKRARNIGSKSKRLLMNSEDAMELRLTWEEAQDLLRPPPSVKPSIVTIEDHEFEEYDEPPVFGKRTIFSTGPSGGQEQWAQCDDCSKWRRVPVDALLPPKWTCLDNVWDSSRCLCSVPEEMCSRDLENLLRVSKDFKKRRTFEGTKPTQEQEPSGLDALASVAVLGDNVVDSGEASFGATTKHPRHRPGCTCIVCIQPPSGKGKHKPTCTCNVCMTVKRRFKTLMLRKKKRQSEREAEISQKEHNDGKDEPEMNGTFGHAALHINNSENEGGQSRIQSDGVESGTGQIDLNCHPNREDMQLEVSGLSMTGLVQAASLPLENYMKQNGMAKMMREEQASLGSCLLTQTNGESERRLLAEEAFLESIPWDRGSRGDERYREPNLD